MMSIGTLRSTSCKFKAILLLSGTTYYVYINIILHMFYYRIVSITALYNILVIVLKIAMTCSSTVI